MHRRGNGTGTLYKKDGFFRYKYTNALGKKQTVTLKDADGQRVSKRKDAEKLIAALTAQTLEVDALKTKTQLMERIAEARGYTCQIPIEGFWERLQTHPNYDCDSDGVNKARIIGSFLKWLADKHPELKTIGEITVEIAGEYLNNVWQSGITGLTYNVKLRILRKALAVFMKEDCPFKDFQNKRHYPESRKPFTEEQLKAIWAAMDDPDFKIVNKQELYVVLKMAYYTGLRRGDICLLKWASIINNSIVLKPSKTAHSSRMVVTIPIVAPLRELLNKLPHNSHYVFPQTAVRYTENIYSLTNDIRHLLEHCGIQTCEKVEGHRKVPALRYGLHSFRHTFISQLLNKGVSAILVRSMVGHRSEMVTQIYAHISDDAKARELAKAFG